MDLVEDYKGTFHCISTHFYSFKFSYFFTLATLASSADELMQLLTIS